MELSPYLDGLRRELHAAAAPGGPEVTRTAELLTGALDAAARLCLMEALGDAAAEITSKLDSATVEVRLRGRDADFVVTPLAEPTPPPQAPEPPTAEVRPYGNTEASRDAADRTVVVLRDDTLVVEGPDTGWSWRRRGQIQVRVRVPEDTHLRVKVASADAALTGRYGDCVLDAASG